jgi:hypothetical protein
MTRAHRRTRVVAALGAGILVLIGLLGVAQAILPGIAASRIRDSLARDGQGVHVSVSAFPAVKLLFGRADSVSVRIHRLDAGGRRLGDLLARTRSVDRLHAGVGQLYSYGLELDGVSLEKVHGRLQGQATVTRRALEAILPVGLSLLASRQSSQAFALTATAQILGQPLSATALVQVNQGRLELIPELPLLRFLTVTLFADPRVAVDSIDAGGGGGAYTFSATGHLR